jgi:hypothetical protein
MFWLALALKLVLTAAIVVSASTVVERAGPLIGALVMTLPVTLGPAYVFLALDHDAAYIARSAEAGLAVNAVTGGFMLLYLLLAQKRGLLVSLGPAFICWIALAWLVRSREWPLYGAALLNLAVYAVCIKISRRYRDAKVPTIAREWYELPLRVTLVSVLMAGVLGLSHWAGPGAAGVLAVYPVSTTCTMLILHSRLGGRASAAVIANGLWGLLGIASGLFTVASSAEVLGKPLSLLLGLLAVPVSWNLAIWYLRQRGNPLSMRLRRVTARK